MSADGVGQPQVGLDHQRAEDVGQQLAERIFAARQAQRLGGGDEVPLDDGLGGAARHPGHARGGGHADAAP